MLDFFNNLSDKAVNTIFVILISVFSLLIIFTMINALRNRTKEIERKNRIIFPEKYLTIYKHKKNKEKKKKKFFLKAFYDEYVFFFKNGKPVIFAGIIGYSIGFLVFYIASDSIPLALILAICILVIEYIFIDNKIAKARKKYIKDFSSAINVLAVSTEAGNTFEKGLNAIVNRETLGQNLRNEFAYINNDLKNNKSLDDALESFYKRNSMFQEIAMFVVVIQFFNKKGGDGLRDIFNELSQSLSNKINNYAEIDAEIGIYKILMNVFIYAYPIAMVGIKMFNPLFYPELLDSGIMGYFKAVGSIVVYVVGVYYYKMMMRNSAEG